MKNSLRIQHFHISFYAPVLGFAGFSLAVLKSEHLFHLPHALSLVLVGFTIFLLGIVGFIYLNKLIFHFQAVKEEFYHPVKINFFPLIAKIFLVLSVFFFEPHAATSWWLWSIGVILNTLFGFLILSAWISHEHFKIHHLSPAWFIPVVGNIIIPIVGVQHANIEISWFFFSVGVAWMFILTTIIFYRLIFHDPLPGKFLPTLFILFAAPAIGFIAYYRLTNSFDMFARLLYYFALFLFLLMLTQWRKFLTNQFYLSWWAYSFPLAAFCLASILMFHITQISLFYLISGFVLVGLTGVIGILSVLTLQAVSRKELCVEE